MYLFLIRGKSKIDWFRKRSGCICAISIPLLSPLFFQFVVNEKICGHTRHSLFFETKQKTNLLVQEVAPGWLELGMNEDFRILLVSSSSVCKEVKVKDYRPGRSWIFLSICLTRTQWKAKLQKKKSSDGRLLYVRILDIIFCCWSNYTVAKDVFLSLDFCDFQIIFLYKILLNDYNVIRTEVFKWLFCRFSANVM